MFAECRDIIDITTWSGKGLEMAQLVVRKLDNDVKERLRQRAARNGHSMEEEAREILTAAVGEDLGTRDGIGAENEGRVRRGGLGSEIAAQFANIEGPPFTIEEIRWGTTRPLPFEESAHDDGDEVVGDDAVGPQDLAL
jgi:plasmid stability protein